MNRITIEDNEGNNISLTKDSFTDLFKYFCSEIILLEIKLSQKDLLSYFLFFVEDLGNDFKFTSKEQIETKIDNFLGKTLK